MRLKQSVLICGSAILTIAGLLLVPYRNLNKIQAFLFGAGAATGFAARYKGRQLEQDQEAFDLQVFEAKQQQKMLEQTTLPVLQEEEVAIAQSRAQANIELQSLKYQKHLQTVKQIEFPGLLEVEIQEARRQSQLESNSSQGARNQQLLPADSGSTEQITDFSGSESTNPNLLGVILPAPPLLGVEFFDWRAFNVTPENYSHFRFVGPTNAGKTTLADWLMDVVPAERKLICTIKRKPHQWQGLEVIGVPENYDLIRETMLKIRSERIRRTKAMEKGETFPSWNIGFDEWKAIAKNIKVETDLETKETISPSARDMQGENITLGRELGLRIFALAQGRQVITWGLEGESDLAECFCSIYMGRFAVNECESYRNNYPKNSTEYAKYEKVRDYLLTLGKRAAWISCELGEYPAIIPDLSKWRRNIPGQSADQVADQNEENQSQDDEDLDLEDEDFDIDSDIDEQRTTLARIYKESPEDAPPWDEWLAEASTAEIDRRIEERRSRRDTGSDTAGYSSEVSSDGIEGEILSEPLHSMEYPRKWDAETFRKILPKEDENALFEKILEYLDTSLDTKGDRTNSYSKVIKLGLGFNKPRDHATRSYWNVGLPCFKYLLEQPGREALKQHFSKAWDSDNEEDQQTNGE
jgi:hypothetical protein